MNKIKKPNIFLYYFMALFIVPYLKLKFNIQSQKRPKIKGSFVVIGNHQVVYDPLFLSYALYGYRLNFVAGYELLLNSKTRWIGKLFHIIPKFQYQIDLKAIKQMLQVVKNKGNLALFPTGRLSSCGVGYHTTIALVKLLKKLNVPVYFCKIQGAYFSAPKWAKKTRKGRVDVAYSLLFTQEQLSIMNEQVMLDLLNENLGYNDYDDQEKRMIAYRGKNLAENLEKILYHCPSCHQEYSLVSQKDVLYCSQCHFEVKIDVYGQFSENSYFKNPLAWFRYQESILQQAITHNQYDLEAKVVVKTSNGNAVVQIGEGTLKLLKNSIVFNGVLLGKEVVMEHDIKALPSLPYRAGVNVEIPYQDKVYIYELENGLSAVKWSLTVEQLNNQINL